MAAGPRFCVFVTLAGFLTGLPASTAEVVARRALSVADVIETRRVLRFPGWDGLVPSPDGFRYAFFLTQGDLARNGNWVEVWAGRLDRAQAAPPRRIARWLTSALADHPRGIDPVIHPIGNVIRWLADSRRIAFLWTDGTEPTQLFAIDVETAAFTALTRHPTSVAAYAISNDGRRIVFDAYPPKAVVDAGAGYRVGIANFFNGWFGGQFVSDSGLLARETFVVRSDGAGSSITPHPNLDRFGRRPAEFSPDGRFLLILRNRIVDLDPGWSAYRHPPLRAMLENQRNDPGGGWITQMALIDLEAKIEAPVWPVPVPLDAEPRALWSPDGRSLVIGPTYLPVSHSSPKGKRGEAIAEVDVRTGAITELPVADSGEPARLQRWTRDEGLIVQVGARSLRFEKRNQRWSATEVSTGRNPSESHSPVEVRIAEDANTPPYVEALDVHSGVRTKLMPIDGRLEQAKLGHVRMLEWTDRERRRWQGRVYYPVDHQSDVRYPLVVQTHGFSPETRFSLLGVDDSLGSVYAAQPLAARGMFVLQVQDHEDGGNTAREPQVHSLGFEAGIDTLDRQGLIDRNRVGLSGFSRAGWYVQYALTFSDFPYVAAIAADNVGYGYVENVLFGRESEYSPVLGRAPVGNGMKAWLENAVPFNAERIRTPLRLEVHTGGIVGLLMPWELFSRLRHAKLPAELIVVPDSEAATHPLQNAGQRLYEQQGVVDWFDFWLNGREREAADPIGQYREWRKLRELRDAAVKIPRPPLLEWSSRAR